MTIPFTFTKDKFSSQKRSSNITISFDGFIQSYASLRNMFAAMPGALHNDQATSCYIPVAESNGLIYLGVEYEGTKVDIKAYLTRPSANLYVDMLVLAGKQYTKVYRKTYHGGKQVGCRGPWRYRWCVVQGPVQVQIQGQGQVQGEAHSSQGLALGSGT